MKNLALLMMLTLLLGGCMNQHEKITINGQEFILTGTQQEGVARAYYNNGNLKSYAEIRNGMLHGKCEDYYESGQLKRTYAHKEGGYDGPYKVYFEDGTLSEAGTYKDCSHDGKMVKNHKDGSPMAEVLYANQKMVSFTEYINHKPQPYELHVTAVRSPMTSLTTYHISISPTPVSVSYYVVKDKTMFRVKELPYTTEYVAGQKIEFIAQGMAKCGLRFTLSKKL